jgi:hypothetical protein
MKLNERKKSDFKIGQELFFTQSYEREYSSRHASTSGRKVGTLIIKKVGSKCIHFEGGNQYRFEDNYTRYHWGRNEWRPATPIDKIFDTEKEAQYEIDKLNLIDSISEKPDVRSFLTQFNYELLVQIEEAIK